MTIAGLIGRGVLALLGLLMALNVVGALYLAISHRLAVNPSVAATLMWDVWVVSWIAAMVWSRGTAARPPALDEFIHWAPTAIGMCLLAFGSAATSFTPLWRLPDVAGWVLAAA